MKDRVVTQEYGFYHLLEPVEDETMSEDVARWPVPFEWDDINQPSGVECWWETPGDGASQFRMPGLSVILPGEEDVS